MGKVSLSKVRKTVGKSTHRHVQSGYGGALTRHAMQDLSRLVSAAGHDVHDILAGNPHRSRRQTPRFGVNIFQLYRAIHSAPANGTVLVDPQNSRYYDFSQHVIHFGARKMEITNFLYRGTRDADFAHADAWAGITAAQRHSSKWVWHHVQDIVPHVSGTHYSFKGTLQLIGEAIHKAYAHNGGVHQSKQILEHAAPTNRDAANLLNGWYV